MDILHQDQPTFKKELPTDQHQSKLLLDQHPQDNQEELTLHRDKHSTVDMVDLSNQQLLSKSLEKRESTLL